MSLPPPPSRITLAEVAKDAQVAVMTASRAMRGDPSVRPYLRERVMASAQRLDYHPNTMARALSNRASDVISLFLYNLDNPYFGTLAEKINNLLFNRGFVPMVANSGAYIDRLNRQTFARGSILMTPDPEVADGLWAQSAVVAIMPKGTVRCPRADIDFEGAYAEVARALIAHGRRRYAIYDTVTPSGESSQYYRLFFRLMRDAGTPVPDRPIQTDLDAVARIVCAGDVDAVLCENDLYAARLVAALARQGIRTPEDVVIVGRDGTLPLRGVWGLGLDYDALAEGIVALLCQQVEGDRSEGACYMQQLVLTTDTTAD